jgi:hypothetical protein
VDKFGKDAEQGGFAAAFHRGFDPEVGTDIPELEAVGMNDPERESFSGVLWQHNETVQGCAQLIEEEGGRV